MADTVRVAGVVPLVGLTLSHEPPLFVDADAVKLTGDPLLTDRDCEAGGGEPCWKPKAKLCGVTVKPVALVTVSVTGMVTDPDDDEITKVPLWVPTDNCRGLTETVTFAGVVPLVGLAESQLPPLVMLTVK